MKYKVKLTYHAIEQMRDIVGYISKSLCEPTIARRWSAKIQKAILTLDEMPLRNPLVQNEPWRTRGVRKMIVNNYIVYYLVDEPGAVVWITAVVYGRQEQMSVLRNMPEP